MKYVYGLHAEYIEYFGNNQNERLITFAIGYFNGISWKERRTTDSALNEANETGEILGTDSSWEMKYYGTHSETRERAFTYHNRRGDK